MVELIEIVTKLSSTYNNVSFTL